MKPRTCLAYALLASIAAVPALARPASADADPQRRVVGVGYKIGNGIGFTGGDIIIDPIPHVSLDLQASYASVAVSSGRATGYGLAPSLQFRLRPTGHTPYVGFGVQYARLALDGVTGSGLGYFGNAGYTWIWSSGLGVLLGGGVQHLPSVRATDGFTTLETSGGTAVNLEVGVRYMFF